MGVRGRSLAKRRENGIDSEDEDDNEDDKLQISYKSTNC